MQNFMKKYFHFQISDLLATVIIVVIVFPVSVSAARLAPPGHVPQTKSLQPLPNQVAPNVSENINAQTGSGGTPEAAPGEETQNSETPEQGNPESTPVNPESAASPASNSGAGFWTWFLAIILLGGGVALFYWKKIRSYLEKQLKKVS
jgi:hypothetical protein